MKTLAKIFAILFFLFCLFIALSLLADLTNSSLASDKRMPYIFVSILFEIPSLTAGILLWRVSSTFTTELQDPNIITDPNNPAILWQISESSKFPRNVFFLKEYDGMRAFVMFIFLTSVWNFFQYYLPHSRGLLGWLPLANTADFYLHLLPLICCYCLLWLTFDSKNFYGYALGAFTAIFGLIYIVSPVDFAPDFVPILGGTDDALLGGGSILMGARSWWQVQEQDKNLKLVMNYLREGDQKTALNLLLADKGVTLKLIANAASAR